MKLNPVKFGIAFGIVYAAIFFLYAILAAQFGWGGEIIELTGSLYFGFGPSFVGALVGVVWGLALGFIFFGGAAWIYNRLLG
jgi:hypothetical protein